MLLSHEDAAQTYQWLYNFPYINNNNINNNNIAVQDNNLQNNFPYINNNNNNIAVQDNFPYVNNNVAVQDNILPETYPYSSNNNNLQYELDTRPFVLDPRCDKHGYIIGMGDAEWSFPLEYKPKFMNADP